MLMCYNHVTTFKHWSGAGRFPNQEKPAFLFWLLATYRSLRGIVPQMNSVVFTENLCPFFVDEVKLRGTLREFNQDIFLNQPVYYFLNRTGKL